MKPLIKVVNLAKSFGTLPVLQQVSFEAYPGEVVGLAGQSGAGKSVLVMLLAGLYAPDQGQLYIDGQRQRWPFRPRQLGIEVIHQKTELVNTLDICSNVFIGNEPGWPQFKGWKLITPRQQMELKTREALAQLEMPIASLREKVVNLSSEQRQLITIARAMIRPARLMIIDDPTALLSYPYQKKLLDLIHHWQQQGITIIYSSNVLDHLFAVTDRIIILREGQSVVSYRTDETDRREIVAAMVGTTQQQQVTPIIWALDSYNRVRERVEKLHQHQTILRQDLALQDELNQQLLKQLNEQVDVLDRTNLALQEAHRRLLTEREQERKHLARELHDQTIQDLLTVNYDLEEIEAREKLSSLYRGKLADIQDNIRLLVEDLRLLCADLRPPSIDSLGLGAAISSLVHNWSQRTHIDAKLELDPALGRLPEAIELSAFRIVQEGLNNVRKHAQATVVEVCLKHTSPRALWISIVDNGRGLQGDFDLSLLAAQGHYGLLGISERVALVGGHWSLENQPTTGLRLQVEIPHPRVGEKVSEFGL